MTAGSELDVSGTLGGDVQDDGVLGLIASNQTCSGAISGAGTFNVFGSDTLFLTGNSGGFEGNTTIADGATLDAATPSALPGYLAGSVSVASGGTLGVNVAGSGVAVIRHPKSVGDQ